MPFPNTPSLIALSEAEFIDLGFSRVSELTNGLLNDRSTVGALYQIIAAQSSLLVEYSGGLNDLPKQVIEQWLVTTGVSRRGATRCVVPVVITLTDRFADAKEIPVGFQASVGNVRFELIQDVTVPPGVAATGDDPATSQIYMQSIEYGPSTNIAAGATWTINTGLSFVASIANGPPVQSGLSIESEDELIDRAIAAIRGDSLVSDQDFERATREFLGSGAAALCIPKLAQDAQTEEIGAVHVFCLEPGGAAPTAARLTQLAQLLSRRSILRTAYASAMDAVEVTLTVEVISQPGFDRLGLAEAVRDRLISYLTPGNLTPGASIINNELEFQARLVTGVDKVKFVSIAEVGSVERRLDLQLPFPYSVAKLTNIKVIVVRGNESFTIESQV